MDNFAILLHTKTQLNRVCLFRFFGVFLASAALRSEFVWTGWCFDFSSGKCLELSRDPRIARTKHSFFKITVRPYFGNHDFVVQGSKQCRLFKAKDVKNSNVLKYLKYPNIFIEKKKVRRFFNKR